jgi:hypothetical protein
MFSEILNPLIKLLSQGQILIETFFRYTFEHQASVVLTFRTNQQTNQPVELDNSKTREDGGAPCPC